MSTTTSEIQRFNKDSKKILSLLLKISLKCLSIINPHKNLKNRKINLVLTPIKIKLLFNKIKDLNFQAKLNN